MLVGVGLGTPVGVTRLLGWVAEVRALSDAPLHLMVNECPGDGFRRAEIADEIHRTSPPAGLWFVPRDDKVEAATWAGDLVASGPFTKALAGLATVLGAPSGNGSTRAGRDGSRRRRTVGAR